jgi:hypothetical protein
MKEGSTKRYRAPLWPDIKSRWCVRHMIANFHSQFKNKTLAKVFERLCEQNQQKKFGDIRKKLDELTKKASEEIAKRLVNPEPGEEPISLEDVGLDGPQVRRRRGRAVKTFNQWIQNEPKEKWCLLFDEGGARHEIKTTNFAESYNCVLHGARPLPLVGIIKFFMYRTMLYFHTRSQIADEVMRNTQMRYCTIMTDYLIKAQDKALKHKVTTQPLHQYDENEIMWSYEVECKGKLGLGPKCEKSFRIVELGNQICRCTSPAHMWSPYVMNCNNSASIGTCHGTTTRKLFGTFGTKQFRVTSCRVLFTENPKENVVFGTFCWLLFYSFLIIYADVGRIIFGL